MSGFDPSMPLCSATTRAGNPCPFHVRWGGPFCKNHLKPPAAERTPVLTNGHAPRSDDRGPCTAVLRSGAPCPKRARISGLCGQHAGKQPLRLYHLTALANEFDEYSAGERFSAGEFVTWVALSVEAAR